MASRSLKAPRWRQWSVDEARTMLSRFDASGQSVGAFARSIGVSPHRISYWRAKLSARERAVAAQAPFVPVELVSRHAAIEISVGPVSLRLPKDTSSERLADILAALARKVGAC